MVDKFQAVVIGGGPGGYVCAIRLAQLGLKTACIESRGSLGGTCLNVGCIPSKSLLNLSEEFHKVKNLSNKGIEIGEVKVNWGKMIKRSRDVAKRLSKGIEFLNKTGYFSYLSKGVETPPLSHPSICTKDHPAYWNLVGEYISHLGPKNLYKCIQRIEDKLGHDRLSKWQPRHLDIDILTWKISSNRGQSLKYKNAQGLTIPHPALNKRKFLLSLFPKKDLKNQLIS